MFDHSDDTKPRRPRRIEVISGPERRREWSRRDKLAIVVESFAPGVNASEVARRHDINPQQLFGWRKAMRAEALALIENARHQEPPAFAPLVIDAATTACAPPAASASPAPDTASESSIEISVGSATVRIRGAADARTLAIVLKALKVLT
jgi:transposase